MATKKPPVQEEKPSEKERGRDKWENVMQSTFGRPDQQENINFASEITKPRGSKIAPQQEELEELEEFENLDEMQQSLFQDKNLILDPAV